jgi:dTDP-4-dehydrorhamnose reductase
MQKQRILILGGDGMVGYQLFKYLSLNHEVKATLHYPAHSQKHYDRFNNENAYFGLDVLDDDRLLSILADFRPQVVINATAVIKQSSLAKERLPSIKLNALFPHHLANICDTMQARMIHFSTDCVFSGSKGNYIEDDISDAEDIYGRTKYLGEVVDKHNCLTLRTSIIGLELKSEFKHGLLEWFLAQKGKVKGFRRAIYAGVTNIELSRIIELVITQHQDLFGVWQVASQPISKYTLLQKIAEKMGRKDIEVVPDDEFICDRSLRADKFTQKTGYICSDWEAMLDELVKLIKAN